MSDNLCPDCKSAPGDDRDAGLCWDCFMKRELDERSHGDTDTQWLKNATDEEIRRYCDPGS